MHLMLQKDDEIVSSWAVHPLGALLIAVNDADPDEIGPMTYVEYDIVIGRQRLRTIDRTGDGDWIVEAVENSALA